MASNVPTIRQFSWLSLVPQLTLTGLLIYLYHVVGYNEPVIAGALTYSMLAFLLRNIIAKDHRQGIKLVKMKKFDEAIPCFKKSILFFGNNSWIDKYRFVTILSSSKMSYKEMGLCNIAFCYSQTGNGQQAKQYYEQVIKEFPENGLALAGLNMLNALK